jgi:hypothetical protein
MYITIYTSLIVYNIDEMTYFYKNSKKKSKILV